MSKRVRENMGIEINDSIIIFDEGHNVESVSEDSCSLKLKESDLLFTQSVKNNNLKLLSFIKNL
jgi:regulator of telomere elongation helicase 1